MKCEKCGKEHDGSFGSGRFCSSFCAHSFSTSKSRKNINDKISDSLHKYYIKDTNTYICEYCGFSTKRKSDLGHHIKFCKKNPINITKQIEYNKTHNYILDNVELDKIVEFINNYLENNKNCEICGKTIEESVHANNKFIPKRLCIDHDHVTNKFRGVLCPRCNSFLGWYEKFKDEIKSYLDNSIP